MKSLDEKFIEHIKGLMHSPVHNYIVPGLSSWMIGEPHKSGKLRLFTCSRNHIESISPHSHRYDFQCLVLKGNIKNSIWSINPCGDLYDEIEIEYCGKIGQYKEKTIGRNHYNFIEYSYSAGDIYGMSNDEIHSIRFSKDSMVLFFEGESYNETSILLDPVVNGQRIPVSKVQPWMFK